MAPESDTYEKLCAIVSSEKFDKVAPYFLERRNTVSAVKKSTKVSRNTIYSYIKPLRSMGYIEYGTPVTRGQNVFIKSTLLSDYLSGRSRLNSEEKKLLARIFSEAIIREILFNQPSTKFSDAIQQSILCIKMLGFDLKDSPAVLGRETPRDDFILKFGVANILLLDKAQVDRFYLLIRKLTNTKTKIKTLNGLIHKLLLNPDALGIARSFSLIQTLAGYENLDTVIQKRIIQKLPKHQIEQIKEELWKNHSLVM
jgi:hypothetical protein